MEPPTYTYVDQLLSESWVSWSERYLSQRADRRYSGSRGWQDYVEHVSGSVNANERTRAKELFECGLLRGRLVQPRSGGTGGTPNGWSLILNDEHAHTAFGYVGYAVGKGLSAIGASPGIENSLSVIAAIIILGKNVGQGDHSVLLIRVFEHIRSSFPLPQELDSATWNRWLAIGMFGTLNDTAGSQALLSSVSADSPCGSLIMASESGDQTVTPAQLQTLATSGGSFNDYRRPKASLFWIGNPSDASPRGIYSIAMRSAVAAELLRGAIRAEKAAMAMSRESPFLQISPREDGSLCMLKAIGDVFREYGELTTWECAMKTLHQGVLESLSALEGNVETGNGPKLLYAHGISAEVKSPQRVLIRVGKNACAAAPIIGDLVSVAGSFCRVDRVDEDGDELVVKASR